MSYVQTYEYTNLSAPTFAAAYGDAGFNRLMAEQYGLRRLFLHAHSLSLPLGGREIAVSAPLDDELKTVLSRLSSAHQRKT